MECEKLMLQGYTQATEISRMLKIARGTAIKYIKIILKRWAEYWSLMERKEAAGKQLRKSENIQTETWKLFKGINTKDKKKKSPSNDSNKIGALRSIIESIKVENKILGLDSDQIKVSQGGKDENIDTYEIWKKKRSKQR